MVNINCPTFKDDYVRNILLLIHDFQAITVPIKFPTQNGTKLPY
jgi:hypothetical protein